MNKAERLFYIAIIILQFFLIFYLTVSSRNVSGKLSVLPERKGDREGHRLYSFEGVDRHGVNKWIHFNNYSEIFFLLVPISNHCTHCRNIVAEINALFNEREVNSAIKVVLLTENDFNLDALSITPLNLLKVSHDDLVQFGFKMPSIFCANGRGDIFLRHDGYREGAIKEIYERLEKIIVQKRRSETIKS